jgi:hypothetical protein
MYTIDPIIYKLNDDRIIALRRGTITKELLLGLINWQKDPFTMQNNTLIFLNSEMQEAQKKQFMDFMVQQIKQNGGLTGTIIYDNFEIFEKIYPELRPSYDVIKSEIEKTNCQGCTKNTKTQPLYDEILKLPPAGRNIDSLSDSLKNYPYIVKKLKNEPFEVNTHDIVIPPEFFRKEIPFLTNEEEMNIYDVVREVPLEMTRESCMDCVRGHLFEAQLLFKEVLKGYTPEKNFEHKGQAIAHLSQAEAESLKEFPELSLKIRILKLKMSGQKKYVRETTSTTAP